MFVIWLAVGGVLPWLLKTLAEGSARFVELKALKNSPRNCSFVPSPIGSGNDLLSVRFTFDSAGPSSRLRDADAPLIVPAGGTVKAVRSKKPSRPPQGMFSRAGELVLTQLW